MTTWKTSTTTYLPVYRSETATINAALASARGAFTWRDYLARLDIALDVLGVRA